MQPINTSDRNVISYLVYTGCLFEENKAEASWPACLLVHLYGAVCHLTEFREIIFKIFLTCVPAKSANKHFPSKEEMNTLNMAID